MNTKITKSKIKIKITKTKITITITTNNNNDNNNNNNIIIIIIIIIHTFDLHPELIAGLDILFPSNHMQPPFTILSSFRFSLSHCVSLIILSHTTAP
jgi:hypothetical protein